MPQEDHEATELQHAEEIGLVIFPTADQAAEIVKPCEQALDFPAAAVATQFAAVLGVLPVAIVFVGCDESNAVFLPEALVERITVGQIVPRSTGAQNPKNSVQHGSRIAPGPTTTVGTSLGSEQGLEDLPLRLGQVHALDLR